jgi:hypothetical protein
MRKKGGYKETRREDRKKKQRRKIKTKKKRINEGKAKQSSERNA